MEGRDGKAGLVGGQQRNTDPILYAQFVARLCKKVAKHAQQSDQHRVFSIY